MAWLAWYSLASMAASYIFVRILEYLFGGVLGGLMHVAKPVAFVSSWSAMTAYGGIRSVNKRARRVRRASATLRNLIIDREESKERQI